MNRNASLEDIKNLIEVTLDQFYEEEELLFLRRSGKGLHERCLHSKFAHHLQNQINEVCEGLEKWYVDCEYNSSWVPMTDDSGNLMRDDDSLIIFLERNRKELRNLEGNVPKKGLFVDIIVHKRMKSETDFFCIELKKEFADKESKDKENDFNKLKQMTDNTREGFGYKFGFYLVLGKKREGTKVTIFHDGKEPEMINIPI